MICLDVMRALAREPEAGRVMRAEMDLARGLHPAMDAWAREVVVDVPEAGARRMVGRLALGVFGSLLLRFAAPAVAEGCCVTRLDGD